MTDRPAGDGGEANPSPPERPTHEHPPPVDPETMFREAPVILRALELARDTRSLGEVVLVDMRHLVAETRRANRKHPAQVLLTVPEEAVKVLRNPREEANAVYALLAIPIRFFEQARGVRVLVDPSNRPVAAASSDSLIVDGASARRR